MELNPIALTFHVYHKLIISPIFALIILK